MEYLYLFLLPAAISFILVPQVLKLAQRYKFYDLSNDRKVHSGIKPYMGGVAIFVAFLVSSLLLTPTDTKLMIILGGGFFYFILGLVDDRVNLPAKLKLILELAVTSIVVYAGINSGLLLENPFGSIGYHPVLLWLSIPFSVLWIVGIANAVNLIDGLDGLASGVIFIACAVLTIAAAINPAVSLSPLLIIVMGSIAGYIRYNLYPSKIIMGDSGALFLGYIIAIISLSSFATPNRSIFLSLIPPAMALCVPILDTLLAILRRRRYGKRIFSADKNHFHHCLLQRGFSHPKVVYIVWGLSASFGIVSLVLSELIFQQVYLALALSGLVLFWAIYSAAGFGIFHIPEEDKALKEAAVSDDAKEVG
jgi:UDP-GlcNAc:undecaprenyl-phosphate GlcNAc-1-phosphate transferase